MGEGGEKVKGVSKTILEEAWEKRGGGGDGKREEGMKGVYKKILEEEWEREYGEKGRGKEKKA